MLDVVGRVEVRPLASVDRNLWNPNRMGEAMRASIRYGLEHDGWLASHSLLVWGTDEREEERGLIIDGEHRWEIARELGFTEGPMVLLYDLPEAKAKALTIKLNRRRGSFDEAKLGDLIRGVELDLEDLGVEDLGLDLGFDDDELMKLMVEPPDEASVPPGSPPDEASVPVDGSPLPASPGLRVVQIILEPDRYDELQDLITYVSQRLSLSDASLTVLEALRMARLELGE
jgi:hypothetical protein